MTNTIVVAVDTARARSFRLQIEDEAGSELTKLEEGPVWVHPEARVKEHDRFSDSTPRGQHGGSPGQTHSFDDRRASHEEEERRRFAKQIAQGIDDLLSNVANARLVICATHAISAPLKVELDQISGRRGVRVQWHMAEATQRGPHQLHEYLAEHELLPPPRAPRAPR